MSGILFFIFASCHPLNHLKDVLRPYVYFKQKGQMVTLSSLPRSLLPFLDYASILFSEIFSLKKTWGYWHKMYTGIQISQNRGSLWENGDFKHKRDFSVTEFRISKSKIKKKKKKVTSKKILRGLQGSELKRCRCNLKIAYFWIWECPPPENQTKRSEKSQSPHHH